MTANLYGKANFITDETWQAGDIELNNSTVNISGENNSILYIMPSPYSTVLAGLSGSYLGSYKSSNTKINVPTKNNSIMIQSGIGGAFLLQSSGDVKFEGASNVFYSGLGYAPNYNKVKSVTNMQGGLLISNLEMYGDENIGILFNTKWTGTLPTVYNSTDNVNEAAHFIGIYQNPISISAKIGNKLTIDDGDTQTSDGNLSKYGEEGKSWTNSAIGVYAVSGQRPGIIPTTHLGAGSYTIYNNDTIHNLEISKFDIRFGEYSKNGVMFYVANGTVLDIANPAAVTGTTLIGSMNTEFTDGIDGKETEEEKASKGTIAVYATGTWKQATHKLGSTKTDAYSNSVAGVADLEGKATEVNVYIPYTMTSSEGIAYYAAAGAVINAKKDTTATMDSSIIAYATGASTVNVDGKITAKDAKVSYVNQYKNIATYAGVNSTINVAGTVNVNGMGAFANAAGAVINLNATDNVIDSGKDGGLIAMIGAVNFGGGTINHGVAIDNCKIDYNNTVPFYAGNSGKIRFKGATTINVYKGTVFNDVRSSFASAVDTDTKYSGMGNVTVNLMNDGLNIGLFKGETVSYTQGEDLIASIALDITHAKIEGKTQTAKVGLSQGSFILAPSTPGTAVNYDYDTEKFQNLLLQRELIYIKDGATLSSSTGKSLTVGSDKDATSNSLSGFVVENGGAVDIKGGTGGNVGLHTSFGTIDVQTGGKITVDSGAGAYGVNGSKVTNSGTITVGSGVGIAGFARKTDAAGNVVAEADKDDYGTDAGKGVNVIEIENNGTITVSGTGAAAIYANNNRADVARDKVLVTNSKALTVGDGSVAVMVKGDTEGGTITLNKESGVTDITVGANGIGVYAQNSDVSIPGTGYTMSVGTSSVGIYAAGKTKLTGDMILNYTGVATGVTSATAAVAYKDNTGATFTNEMNLTMTGTANTLAGIYASGSGNIVNKGDITSTSDGAYGIISEGLNVDNQSGAKIAVGSATDGGTGIFVSDANLDVYGDDIAITGAGAQGAYVSGTGTATVRAGSDALKVVGTSAVGITKSQGTLTNNSKVVLTNSTTKADRRVGIIALDGAIVTNATGADITVGDNNIGIYSDGSNLTNNATLDVTAGNGTETVGIYALGAGTTSQAGTLNVGGLNNVGIYAIKGTVSVTGNVNVTPTSTGTDIPIGTYVKGTGIAVTIDNTSGTKTTVNPNGLGLNIDGASTATLTSAAFDLSSNTTGDVGIGAYFTNGATATGDVTVTSTATAVDAASKPVRPIGLYYATGSTANSANVTLNGTNDVIGIYGSGSGNFAQSGNVTVNSKGIGAYFSGMNVSNTGTVNVNSADSYGLFFNGGTSSSTGNITASDSKAIGAISSGSTGKYTSNSAITVTGENAVGIAAVSGGTATNNKTIDISSSATAGSYGMVANGAGSKVINAGTITESGSVKSTGAVAIYGGTVEMASGSITMTNTGATAVYASGSSANLTGGTITVGAQGAGLYAENSTANLNTSMVLRSKAIGVYSKDSNLGTSGKLDITYSDTTDKGVGIYYTSATAGTSVTNNVEVAHTTGMNLVDIYAENVSLTNKAKLQVQETGVGIYATGSTVANTGTLDVQGKGAVGIYLANNSTLTNIGTITDTSASGDVKVGIYVNSGSNITGTSSYDFGIQGGVGIYLNSTDIGYTGTVNVNAASKTANNRTIGIFADNVTSGTIATNINLSGAGAIGIYLPSTSAAASDPKPSSITYNGKMNIIANSTDASVKGIGAYVGNGSSLTLGTSSDINIAGTGNIGFYVANGGSFSILGGKITNTASGIFAYLDGGTLEFGGASTLDINYANAAAAGTTGKITNKTTVTTGTNGLQAADGATVLNDTTGVLNASVAEAKGLVGTVKSGVSANTIVTNKGIINLTGDKSIGIYAAGNTAGGTTTATSDGSVTVGTNGTAFYAGAGGTININATGTVGEGGTLIYADGGTINYSAGNITTPDKTSALTITKSSSTVNLGGADISVGDHSTGIFITGDGNFNNITGLGNITAGANGVGIYADTTNAVSLTKNVTISGNDGVAISSKNSGSIQYATGTIKGATTAVGAKGIVSTGSGTITNSGTINLPGISSIGIYANVSPSINNSGNIILGDGTSASSAVGIYGSLAGATKVDMDNSGDIKLTSYGVGIYGNNADIDHQSAGYIHNGEGNNTGIYGVDSTIRVTGDINLSDKSTGVIGATSGAITVDNGTNITVGNESAGVYATGTTTVNVNGNIKVGNDAVGIQSGSGNIIVSNTATIDAGTGSTSIYTVSGNAENNATLNLKAAGIGMYTETGTVTNKATINTGSSDITVNPAKISVAMAAIGKDGVGGSAVNEGTINIPTSMSNSIGMYSSEGGTATNKNDIYVNAQDAYGMMASGKGSSIINDTTGDIWVAGDSARGMSVTQGAYGENNGNIWVQGHNAEGIYVGDGSRFVNNGDITVTGTGAVSLTKGENGTFINNNGSITITQKVESATESTAGNITIKGPEIFNGIKQLVNAGGNIDIEFIGGEDSKITLDFGTIYIAGSGSDAGKDTYIGSITTNVDATGELVILSNMVTGSNRDAYVAQYVTTGSLPHGGHITAISQSVSYVVDLQTISGVSGFKVVLVKIPYTTMTAGTEAATFGAGLDELYARVDVDAPGDRLQAMFDSLDSIDDKDELARVMEQELRGNEYANIQDRIFDVSEIIDRYVASLASSNLYTKDELKIGAIFTRSEAEFSKTDILDYDVTSYGAVALKEYDGRTYGRTYGWELAFAKSDFEFDGRQSTEDIYTLHGGVSYRQNVGHNDNVKWYANATVNANYHDMDRYIDISGDIYNNDSDYYSAVANVSNKIRYEKGSANGLLKGGLHAMASLGYGQYFDISEKGDGNLLELPATDFYSIRPGVGADVTFTGRGKLGKLSLTAKASYEYELGDMYDDKGNTVKYKSTTPDVWTLVPPKNDDNIIKYGAELKYETRGGSSIGVEVVRRESRRDTTSYGLNLMMKLGK